jgi:hypothetical protein
MPRANRGGRYGYRHQRARASWEKRGVVGRPCAKCGRPILDGQPWDLGHSDDGMTYTGPEHAACNRSDGARRGNAARRRRPALRPERDW